MAESKCEIKDHRNNGLITKIWGESGWVMCHSITFGYPLDPSDHDKIKYKLFFEMLGEVLPCKYCRESYLKFISEGPTALTENKLKNRESLTKWLYDLHNQVNNKLGMDYGVTYEDVVTRYESFRAKCDGNSSVVHGCVVPLDYKAFSYKKLKQKDCPIIKFELLEPFYKLALKRNLSKIYPKCFNYYHKILSKTENVSDPEKLIILKKSKNWPRRNIYCSKLIKRMRENGTASVEIMGEFKGTPTIEELKLIMCMCSNLCNKELDQCLDFTKKLI